MCPPSHHHNCFMATPELGQRMYSSTLCARIRLCHQLSAQTVNSSSQCVVQIACIYQILKEKNRQNYKNSIQQDNEMKI